MDRNILAGILAVPFLLVSGQFAISGCHYTEPELVFEAACRDDACLAHVRKHLPACKRSMASQLTKTIRHEDGIEKAPYLSIAVMDKLTDCIASSGFGTFDRSSVDFSQFSEVSKDVRADKPITGAKSGLHMLPVVGQTTFLYAPF